MKERRQVGTRIRKAREAVGLSQEDVGDALGLSRSAVSQWEKGQSSPTESNLVTLSGVLKVNPDYLIRGKGKPPVLVEIKESGEFRRSSINRIKRLIATGALDDMLEDLGYPKKRR